MDSENTGEQMSNTAMEKILKTTTPNSIKFFDDGAITLEYDQTSLITNHIKAFCSDSDGWCKGYTSIWNQHVTVYYFHPFVGDTSIRHPGCYEDEVYVCFERLPII